MNNAKGRACVRSTRALDILVILAMAATTVILVMVGLRAARSIVPPPVLTSHPISYGDSALIGSRIAPAVMMMFSDFSCVHCANFAGEVWPRIHQDFVSTGRLLVAFRSLPLTQSGSRRMAEFAECSDRQGLFWETHDQLFFLRGKRLDAPGLNVMIGQLGIDRDELDRCMTKEGPARVDANVSLARKLRVGGTPAFVFGIRLENVPEAMQPLAAISGARDFDYFHNILVQTLANERR